MFIEGVFPGEVSVYGVTVCSLIVEGAVVIETKLGTTGRDVLLIVVAGAAGDTVLEVVITIVANAVDVPVKLVEVNVVVPEAYAVTVESSMTVMIVLGPEVTVIVTGSVTNAVEVPV